MRNSAAFQLRCLGAAVALECLLPRPPARAEGALSYKFQSWREDGDRIQVDSHCALAEQTLPADTRLKLSGVIDSIAGATPTGQLPSVTGGPVPLTEMNDRREAWQLELSRQAGRFNVAIGYANSRESDYLSRGGSVNLQTDFNQKNTTLLVGVAGTRDRVRVFFQDPWESKRSFQAIAGVTQLLGPETSLSFNVTGGSESGYLADPYRLIEKHVEVGPGLVLLQTFGENRPRHRDKWIALASLNRAVPRLAGAAELTYRLYHDSYGITAHTATAEWYQRCLGGRLLLRPSLRWYRQGAADFYRTTLDGTTVVPHERPDPAGPYYSADYRLSSMTTFTYGLKAAATLLPGRLTADVSVERYTMRGRDDFTPRGVYVDATVFTAGASFTW